MTTALIVLGIVSYLACGAACAIGMRRPYRLSSFEAIKVLFFWPLLFVVLAVMTFIDHLANQQERDK